MKISGRLVVTTDVESVRMEWPRTRYDEVIGYASAGQRLRETLQESYCHGRQPAYGNQVTGERSAPCARIRICCRSRIINLAAATSNRSKIFAQITHTCRSSTGGQNFSRWNRYFLAKAVGLPGPLVIAEVE